MKKQINKEALVTILCYLGYFLWWYYFAYIYPPKNVQDYNYILGLPDWFFYSCILGFILFNFIVIVVIKFFFKNVNLDTEEVENE